MVIGGQTLAPRVPRPASAIAILLLGLASAIRSGVGAEISPDDLAFFEREIRPLLVANCHQCHSEEGGKRKGGLWLDRRAGWEAGGDSGAAVRPGDPAKSLLIEAVRYTNPDREMPPDGKLSAEKIAKLEEWVRRGAPDPRDEPTAPRDNEKDAENRETLELERGRRFWSFQPVQEPPVPAPKDAAWPRTDIDRFIRARQEAENLAPMPDADRETLLRRLTIVLTGLPPTLAEREAFLAADEPGAAFESAVDRLLASDAFAERWGRHWLDIVRYSDTSGGGRALTFTDAWRFRDYVIDSFRKDKPLDRLVREHIAGDLLPFESPAQQLEQLSGTGFLVLGPHNYENQDKELLELEIVDEQLDTLGQAFLGLTLGCARCHDHKFDPIPATDYYAMAGILTSTHSVNHANVSQWMTRAVAVSDEERGAHEAWLARDAALETEIAAVRESLGEFGGDLPKSASIEGLEGLVLDNTDAERTGDWSDSTSNPRFVGDGYLHCDGEGGDTSYAVFRLRVPADGRYEVRVSYSAGTNRVRDASVTVWHAKGDDTLRIDQRKPPRHARLFEDVGVFEFETDKEVMVRVGNQGVKSRGVVVADAVQLVPEAEAVRAAAAAPDRDRIAALEDRLKKLQAEQRALEKSRPNLPSVMCVEDGESPADTAVRVGGLPRNLGKTPPRGFLRVTAPEGAPRPRSAPAAAVWSWPRG